MIHSPSVPAAMMKLLCSCPSGRSSPMRVMRMFRRASHPRGKAAVRIRHAQLQWLAVGSLTRYHRIAEIESSRRRRGRLQRVFRQPWQAATRLRSRSAASARTPNTAASPPAADHAGRKRRRRPRLHQLLPHRIAHEIVHPRSDAGTALPSSKDAHSRPPLRNRNRETAARTDNTPAASDCDTPLESACSTSRSRISRPFTKTKIELRLFFCTCGRETNPRNGISARRLIRLRHLQRRACACRRSIRSSSNWLPNTWNTRSRSVSTGVACSRFAPPFHSSNVLSGCARL